MSDEKPFKSIEVVDSRTNQTCKVACMSCIRGHRTTSCGIPVCRTKIFWTVKRPGRPSNSCTCRYGATGGCKCVVTKSACPHKFKKGEKRSGECRCDEQGRYCCLLEPEHWTALLSLQRPVVDFYSSKEAMEYKQTTSGQLLNDQMSSYSSMASPAMNSMPGTPAPQNGRMQPVHILPNSLQAFRPTPSTLSPQFNMMSTGPSLGSQTHIQPAPRDRPPQHLFEALVTESENHSCCQGSTSATQDIYSPIQNRTLLPPQPLSEMQLPQRFDMMTPQTVSMSQVSSVAPATPSTYDFNKFQADYLNYQFPSSICQNCGLNGCTCRNCPPVFQNFGTTSWAQCCGRKHARDVQPTPPPQQRKKLARTGSYDPFQTPHESATDLETASTAAAAGAFEANGLHYGEESFTEMCIPPTDHPPDTFDDFDLDQALILPDGTDLADLSEFLLSDLDTSNQVGDEEIDHGGTRDTGGGGAKEERPPGEKDPDDDERGGGGCCCGG